MRQTEFGLFECYVMAACRGMKAIINNGELEGFTKEEDHEVQEHVSEKVSGMREGI